MSINDGFGDDLTVAEQIGNYERWAHAVANDLLDAPDHPDHEDLVQEARIGLWKALRSHDPAKGALPSYVTQGARWQMREAVTRKKWTGQETTKGVRRADRHQPTDSLEALVDAGATSMLAAADVLDEVTLAYHYGQIHRAVAALAPEHREYVYLRFWAGLTGAEIAARTGVKDTTWRFRWTKHIVPALREHLAHLETV